MRHYFNSPSLILGPLIALACYLLLAYLQFSHASAITAAIACCCIIWWIFEPIPIPITSLLPLAALPLFGVLSAQQVGAAYGSKLILLLLGGFLLSTAMSYSGAHKRIALGMVNFLGHQHPRRVVFGFILASALLSMWISNTATTLMLLPVALAILQSIDNAKDKKDMATPLFLGIAYAASIGGIGTPIGTPPNLIFMQVYESSTGQSISFIQWMGYALPLLLLMIPILGFYLCRNLQKLQNNSGIQIPTTGKWRSHEKRVLGVFFITATLWVTRREPFGGWSEWLNLPNANDASVALLAVILLFVIPSGKKAEHKHNQHTSEKLLNWESAQNIPWGVLLLFGGGMCLAKGFMVSGLSDHIGAALSHLHSLPIFFMICALTLLVTFMTEATSNTATTALLMPVLAAAALGMNIDPKILMLPAAMSASCAFMLPVATAPNSVIYGSGYVPSQVMAREGFMLNIIGAVLISGLSYYFFVVL